MTTLKTSQERNDTTIDTPSANFPAVVLRIEIPLTCDELGWNISKPAQVKPHLSTTLNRADIWGTRVKWCMFALREMTLYWSKTALFQASKRAKDIKPRSAKAHHWIASFHTRYCPRQPWFKCFMLVFWGLFRVCFSRSGFSNARSHCSAGCGGAQAYQDLERRDTVELCLSSGKWLQCKK